ncbi:unnamed protein product [Pleuronectes platessa]|uniref:Transcription cofactor vestigial-like protein 1 n=1 Tax=Pleuronectes platessa TaxID=8262 RepID=A0A9N7ZAR7_PLEPL|nr:unnamed protein product [Pleuronectes platessa]
MAVKVEEHSRGVILTYFQGDINSMVDAHFTRALRGDCKAKAPAAKTKKTRKSIKLESSSSCQGRAVDPYTEAQSPPAAERLLTFGPAAETPPGLSLTGQQYATSLLNLLHSDRGEMGPSMASSSKPELLPSWTVPQGFRESVDPSVGFEPERRLDKKDLYWY